MSVRSRDYIGRLYNLWYGVRSNGYAVWSRSGLAEWFTDWWWSSRQISTRLSGCPERLHVFYNASWSIHGPATMTQRSPSSPCDVWGPVPHLDSDALGFAGATLCGESFFIMIMTINLSSCDSQSCPFPDVRRQFQQLIGPDKFNVVTLKSGNPSTAWLETNVSTATHVWKTMKVNTVKCETSHLSA